MTEVGREPSRGEANTQSADSSAEDVATPALIADGPLWLPRRPMFARRDRQSGDTPEWLQDN